MEWIIAIVISYIPATEYVDGSPLALEDITKTQILCGDEIVSDEEGAGGEAEINLNESAYCRGRHMADLQWSDWSTPILVRVGPRPNPPELTK